MGDNIDNMSSDKTDDSAGKGSVQSGKATKLLLNRVYNTYQGLFEAYPQNGMTAGQCFSKIILYIMDWLRTRIGVENIESVSSLEFLKNDYPEVYRYEEFDISKVKDIEYLGEADVRTAYDDKNKSWHFTLTEPDNGNDGVSVPGRSFTTNVCVYMKESTAVLGVQTLCKDPSDSQGDANVYRPAFIKSIVRNRGRRDEAEDIRDILLTEADVPVEYAFIDKPLIVNGKSGDECKRLRTGLIDNTSRQLPVLFVPGDFYERFGTYIEGKTRSYLGFCHVVVWRNTANKLFGQVMDSEELRSAAEEDGCLILYKGRSEERGLDVSYVDPGAYGIDDYEEMSKTMKEELPVGPDGESMRKLAEARLERMQKKVTEDISEELDGMVKRDEPIRRAYSFADYPLEADKWNPEKILMAFAEDLPGDVTQRLETEISKKQAYIDELQRDIENLHKKLMETERSAKDIDKDCRKAYAQLAREQKDREQIESKYTEVMKELSETKAEKELLKKKISGMTAGFVSMYKPLINLPRLEMSAKEEILKWIDKYYSDVIIVHDSARKSFMKSQRNIDWREFCMMIHYIAGYTLNRNSGGAMLDNDSARAYDPEEYAFKVTPVSTGSGGSKVTNSDSYTIDISRYDKEEKNVVLDLHVAKGMGRDADMTRIYMYYDSNIRKMIIGSMPEHLPTRTNRH